MFFYHNYSLLKVGMLVKYHCIVIFLQPLVQALFFVYFLFNNIQTLQDIKPSIIQTRKQ